MQGSLYLSKTFRADRLNGVSPVFNKTPFYQPFSICPERFNVNTIHCEQFHESIMAKTEKSICLFKMIHLRRDLKVERLSKLRSKLDFEVRLCRSKLKFNLDRGLGNLWTSRSLPLQQVFLKREMLVQSTPHVFMKLFTIYGVYIKTFGKLKMAQDAVLLNTG